MSNADRKFCIGGVDEESYSKCYSTLITNNKAANEVLCVWRAERKPQASDWGVGGGKWKDYADQTKV